MSVLRRSYDFTGILALEHLFHTAARQQAPEQSFESFKLISVKAMNLLEEAQELIVLDAECLFEFYALAFNQILSINI